MKIVLDTNVLISALHFGGPPRVIMERIIRGTEQLVLSTSIPDELAEVLQRKRFDFPPEAVEAVLGELTAIGTLVRPTEAINGVLQNPDDHKILECAVESAASYLITGDRHLLQLGHYRGIQIVTPAEFLHIVAENGKEPDPEE